MGIATGKYGSNLPWGVTNNFEVVMPNGQVCPENTLAYPGQISAQAMAYHAGFLYICGGYDADRPTHLSAQTGKSHTYYYNQTKHGKKTKLKLCQCWRWINANDNSTNHHKTNFNGEIPQSTSWDHLISSVSLFDAAVLDSSCKLKNFHNS